MNDTNVDCFTFARIGEYWSIDDSPSIAAEELGVSESVVLEVYAILDSNDHQTKVTESIWKYWLLNENPATVARKLEIDISEALRVYDRLDSGLDILRTILKLLEENDCLSFSELSERSPYTKEQIREGISDTIAVVRCEKLWVRSSDE